MTEQQQYPTRDLCEFEWSTDIGVHDCEKYRGHVLPHKCRCGRKRGGLIHD